MTRPLVVLSDLINHFYVELGTWEKAAKECGVLTETGEPDRGLAYRLAHGYQPKSRELCKRLNIPEYCNTCKRPIPKAPKPRPPGWVARAASLLKAAYNPTPPTGGRCYTRAGRLYHPEE